jgi:thiol-disulfide isomerase/thioredoxin
MYILLAMPLPVITEIRDRNHFLEIIKSNPGILIIKFGAKWCGPCKVIENDVKYAFSVMPDNVQCMNIDIDLYPDVYAFLKAKRIVNGVPAILSYVKTNLSYIPDDIVIGANTPDVRAFFTRCLDMANQI